MFTRISVLTLALLVAPLATPAIAASSVERVVTDYIADWNMRDVPKAIGQLAYNVTYVGAGKTFTGREAARIGMLGNFIDAVPDGIWSLTQSHVIDDHNLALEWEVLVTNTGMWPDGSMPTGRPVVLHGISMFEVVDGKIVNQADYYSRGS